MRILTCGAMTLALIGLAACDRQTTEPYPLSLTLDEPVYLARPLVGGVVWQFRVIVTTLNGGSEDIVIPLCSGKPFYGFDTADGTEDSAYSPIYGCEMQTTSPVLRAGASRVDTVLVSGPNSVNGLTGEIGGALQGTVRMGVSTDHGTARSAPVRIGLAAVR